MKLKIDQSARLFSFTGQSDEHGDLRRYYVAKASTGRRMLLVCRNGTELGQLRGMVVDAQVGWERGTLGFVHEDNVGMQHTKVTLYRELGGRWVKTLGEVLRRAPHQENDD